MSIIRGIFDILISPLMLTLFCLRNLFRGERNGD